MDELFHDDDEGTGIGFVLGVDVEEGVFEEEAELGFEVVLVVFEAFGLGEDEVDYVGGDHPAFDVLVQEVSGQAQDNLFGVDHEDLLGFSLVSQTLIKLFCVIRKIRDSRLWRFLHSNEHTGTLVCLQ